MTAPIMRGSDVPVPAGPKCARCGKPIREDGHGGFCSADCALLAGAARSQAELRRRVEERDRGVCAECGFDAPAARLALDELKATDVRLWKARVQGLVVLGFDRHALESGASLWEAAHRVARVRGGPDTLENCITLCLAHHHEDTAKLAGERAKYSRLRRGR